MHYLHLVNHSQSFVHKKAILLRQIGARGLQLSLQSYSIFLKVKIINIALMSNKIINKICERNYHNEQNLEFSASSVYSFFLRDSLHLRIRIDIGICFL